MSQVTVPIGRTLMTGNEAAANAVMLARARVIACYPITPQTLIVERLAELVAGRDDIEYANLESEHSMFGYAIAASRVGVRTFTATSSQGCSTHTSSSIGPRASACRSSPSTSTGPCFAPWSLEPDLADSMGQRDTGWIQLYCSSVQEVLDSVLCAYRIAEAALLPVLVCAEGFLLSHTAEVIEVPTQDEVDAFIPPLRPPDEWLLDPSVARRTRRCREPKEYARFQRNVSEAIDEARLDRREGRRRLQRALRSRPRWARSRSPATPTPKRPRHDRDDRRHRAGASRRRRRPAARPHPRLQTVPRSRTDRRPSGAAHVWVVDRAAAFGSFGPLGPTSGRSSSRRGAVTNVICGVGGTEVTPATLRWALDPTQSAQRPRPIYVPEGV